MARSVPHSSVTPWSDPERIDRWLLFEERYVLVLSRKHPMARQTVIPLQDLHEAVFLERVGCDVASRF